MADLFGGDTKIINQTAGGGGFADLLKKLGHQLRLWGLSETGFSHLVWAARPPVFRGCASRRAVYWAACWGEVLAERGSAMWVYRLCRRF